MRQIFKYDENGKWIPSETEFIYPDKNGNYEIPETFTDVPVPMPNYKPVFDASKKEWVETITEEELQALRNQPTPKSELDILKETVDQLVLDNLMGGI